jgi:peptidoglycan/LPS O-acetylase OafA/YrhL
MKQTANSVYFPNLNGLRFVAAFMVLVAHLEWVKKIEGVANVASLKSVNSLGDYGVSLFFVLSGFLITYLLLQEKQRTGGVSVRKFYVRRILRIWPLYFLTILLAFFILPPLISLKGLELPLSDATYYYKLFLFLFLMANVAYSLFPMVPFASPLWSVGVEEQFYLLWPHVIKKTGRNFPKIMIILIVLMVSMRIAAGVAYHFDRDSTLYYRLYHLLKHFRIQNMALGGLGAYIVHEKIEKLHNLICHRRVERINLLLLFTALIGGIRFSVVNNEVFALMFVILIVNVATNPKTILHLEGRIFRYLGKISYGIYIYQLLALKLAFIIVSRTTGFDFLFFGQGFYYFLGISLTLLLALVSYELFEKHLLRYKGRFEVIPNSRPVK